MTIEELVEESHATAKEKCFWENNNIPEKIMLVVTELAEAVEALRKEKRQISQEDYDKLKVVDIGGGVMMGGFKVNRWHKDTFEDEIADAFIRLADLCGYMNIDIEWQLKEKMKFNQTRPKLHGKKF